ncbi:MAG: preprotein translocase subunit YajC [Cellulomonas iranensis]|uniref:preprotein translocase subunit YajC n=1 Tax=Cellulomonas iranensis TaxID=76862 RepID=UPI001B00DF0E|nr:preprotein translocase subunit YajC [Cellulomonas iranensis]MBO9569686.1 preprotein translocase subunit YajC [Cellulomonas iranensis]
MDYSFVILLVVAFGGLLFMSNRSRKQQREAQDFRANLVIGDEVMTGSGLFGTVTAIEDDVITLESTPGTRTRWLRAAIARKVEPPVVAEDVDDEADDDAAVVDDAVVDVPDDLSSLPPEPPSAREGDRDSK